MLQVLSYGVSNNSQGTCTIAKPSGLALNDFMLAVISVRRSEADTIIPPSGWTLVKHTPMSGSAMQVSTYQKYADANDVAASDFTFGLALNTYNKGVVLRMSAPAALSFHTQDTTSGTSANIANGNMGSHNLYMVVAGSDEINTWNVSGLSKEVEVNDNIVMSVMVASSASPAGFWAITNNIVRDNDIGAMCVHAFYLDELAFTPQVRVVSERHENALNANEHDCNKPDGLQAGDLMVAYLIRDASNASAVNAPSGWNFIINAMPSQSAKWQIFGYWKIATAADVASSTPYKWSWTGTVPARVVILRIVGHDPTNPIYDFAWDEDGQSGNRQPNIFDTVGGSYGLPFDPAANSLILSAYAGSNNSAGASVPVAATDDYLWTEWADIASPNQTNEYQFQVCSSFRPPSTRLGNVSIDGGTTMTGMAMFISILAATVGSPSASVSPSISPSASVSPSASASSSRSTSISVSPSASASPSKSPSSSVSPSPSAGIPINAISVLTAINRSKQGLSFPIFTVGGVGQGGVNFGMFKKGTTYGFHYKRTQLFKVGADFTVLEIGFPVLPGVSGNVDVLPVLYFDNKTKISVGNRINVANYPNNPNFIKLTSKNFQNAVEGKTNFFLEFRWFGTDLFTIGIPIKFTLDVKDEQ